MAYKTPGKTSQYIRSLLPDEQDERVKIILEYADKTTIPVLLPETAAFLRQTITLAKPRRILEIGTAIGYSGTLMLSAAPLDAKLFTIEYDERSVPIAKDFFCRNGLSERVTVFQGDANEIVPQLSGEFDFIFLDGAKSRYLFYLPYLARVLKKGGILFCDNVLFNGRVSGEVNISDSQNSIVERLDKFLHVLFGDERFQSSVLPVGDGVSLSIKLI